MTALSSNAFTLDVLVQAPLPEPLQADPVVQRVLGLPWPQWIGVWLRSLADDLPPAPGYELTLMLTDDATIQTFNRDYRHQDRPTDVLAFAALESPLELPDQGAMPKALSMPAEPLYLGDIVVSLEQALHQAQERGHPGETEVVWLTCHGVLHLLGWDHPDDLTLTAMVAQQAHLLNLIDVQAPPWE